MSKTLEIVDLLDKGFRPYSGHVPEAFYKERRCHDPKKAEWFFRPWSEEHKMSRFLCLGCRKRCVAVDPLGFQILLPVKPTRPGSVVFAPMHAITVEELLRIKSVLRLDEAAWALNVSRTTVSNMVEEGTLDVVPGVPIRVTSASVQRNLQPV
ncbi:DNA-binding protein [Desulfovibrio cuneatus]|uniref:DNA-binding protein n=1 Tax=Desulfovibrio cuneatus TaxID=159728 RepID=UPI00041E7D57|nr:DNA-binding protein [Desulfovibrio cuneatus]